MSNSKSNRAAAMFLKVSLPTYRKYAKLYIDNESGKSLYELHKNMSGVGIKKRFPYAYSGKHGVASILRGEQPEYPSRQLKKRIIKEGFKAECCESCGFSERRVNDYTVPLILVWIDGDKTNHLLDNLLLICYNCFYLTQSDLFNRRADRIDFKGYRDEN
tara:strand:+ start:1430 stop:1909 length:480 start_codon:yes stop_codon:yes gene_type:complete